MGFSTKNFKKIITNGEKYDMIGSKENYGHREGKNAP